MRGEGREPPGGSNIVEYELRRLGKVWVSKKANLPPRELLVRADSTRVWQRDRGASSWLDDQSPDDLCDLEAKLTARDLRGRVKRARAVIASTPGLADVLASDPRRAAMFYPRFGVTEEWVRNGVPKVAAPDSDIADSFLFAEPDPRQGETDASRSTLSGSA